MRAEFLGVPLDALTLDETVAKAVTAMQTRGQCQHVALNVAKLVKMRSNEELRRDVLNSDIISIDGMGIVWGARLLGLDIPERVTGIGLFERIITVCAHQGFRPYFLGAQEDVLKSALHNLRIKYPAMQIAGWHDGYFNVNQEDEVIVAIRESGADCLFIGLPTPRKERLLAKFRDKLNVPFIMGVGGTFDVVAGAVNRAPVWVQDTGLEWLYRLLQEPRRLFWRYFTTNTAFALLLVRACIVRTLKSADKS
jgi:N-acetylglucosaminyldiphosphoundecaprenol N-acetyl-beta-D-mannosaminyltransferase